MAFQSSLLTIDRGAFNNNTGTQSFSVHRYGISADTFAQIEVANYFPDYLGARQDEINLNDRLIIVDNTLAQITYQLTSLSPLSIVRAEVIGSVSGPATTTPNAIATWSDSSGENLKDASSFLIDPSGEFLGVGKMLMASDASFDAEPTAVLQSASFTQGFLVPRMSTAQRDAIVSPAVGLIIFNITANVLDIYDGINWGAHYPVDAFSNSFNWSGAITSTPGGTAKFRECGDMVIMELPSFGDTVTSASPFIGTAVVPAGLRPGSTIIWAKIGTNNSVTQVQLVEINSGGDVNWWGSDGSPNFALGPAAIGGCTFSWLKV